jgi:hypothetical protein
MAISSIAQVCKDGLAWLSTSSQRYPNTVVEWGKGETQLGGLMGPDSESCQH